MWKRIMKMLLGYILLLFAVIYTKAESDLPTYIQPPYGVDIINMNMCSEDAPCPIAQTCADVPTLGYVCQCPQGYIGDTCSTACQASRADIAFLLDSSDSLSETDWGQVLYFVSTVIYHLRIEQGIHRVAVISFGDNATLEFNLDAYNNTRAILDRVLSLPFRQELTNTSGALWRMRYDIFGRRSGAVPMGIIITDGASTVDEHLTVAEAQRTKDAGIVMFAIGVSDEIKVEELEALASDPLSKHLFLVSAFSALSDITNAILEEACEVVPIYRTGATGATGDDGYIGISGDRGPPGNGGLVGEQGVPGEEGLMGELGLQGPPGYIGDDGEQGNPGATGSVGLRGAEGGKGLDGWPGDRGMPGVSLPGHRGTLGAIGQMGELGATGLAGSPGLDGFRGPQGPAGAKGTSGFIGFAGHAGPFGLSGPPGASGHPGEPGISGVVGLPGYIYEDSNECLLNVSLCQHVCVNKRVSYECLCHKGYTLMEDGHHCKDVDECATNNGGCVQFCHNSIGSHECSCTHGYTLSFDDRTCMDVDECCTDLWLDPCTKTHMCINTLGSYYCAHKALIKDITASGSESTEAVVADQRSVFLRRNIIIGLLVWLCALTVLIFICVILASTLHTPDPYIKALEGEVFRESHQHGSQEVMPRVFPRLSLATRHPVIDASVRHQDEIHMPLPTARDSRHVELQDNAAAAAASNST